MSHVDRRLLAISRRYEKRYNLGLGDEDVLPDDERGYENFREIAKDIDGIIDVVWVSGTRMDFNPAPISICPVHDNDADCRL